MSNLWAGVDRLMRELGSARAVANTLKKGDQLEVDVQQGIERAIEAAATAVDDMIAAPSDGARTKRACEAIAVAQDLVEKVSATAGPSRRLAGDSLEMRRRTAELIKTAATAGPRRSLDRDEP